MKTAGDIASCFLFYHSVKVVGGKNLQPYRNPHIFLNSGFLLKHCTEVGVENGVMQQVR